MSPSAETPLKPDARVAVNGQPSLSDRVKGLRLGNEQLSGQKTSWSGSAWLPWLLCLLMAITWASLAIRSYSSGKLKVGSDAAAKKPTTAADSGAKSDGPMKSAAPGEMVLERKGNLVPAHQIQVSPIEVSGRIVELYLQEGKQFRKGDPLAILDKTPYQADHDEAQAQRDAAQTRLKEFEEAWPKEVEQAKAQLEEAQSLMNQYERDYSRYEEIRMRNQGVNEKEYEQAKFGFYTQSARVKQMKVGLQLMEGPRKLKIDTAKAELRQAQARYDRAKWRLDNCTIVAPVDGIVLTKRAEVGNLINALAMNATLNGGICDMADLTDMEVDLDVEERDLTKVFPGQYCTVKVDAYPNRLYHARVDRILPEANSSKAVMPLRVKVRVARKDEGKFLRPKMGATVVFFNKEAGPEPKEAPEPIITQ